MNGLGGNGVGQCQPAEIVVADGLVVAQVQVRVKQVFFRNDKMILQPANDNYQPLVLDHNEQKERNVQIIGKVLHNRIKF